MNNFANENPNAQRDALIVDWQRLKQQKEALEEQELIARNKVIAFFHEDVTDKAGTENVDLGGGYKLKMVFAQRHSVPSAENGAAVRAVMEQLKGMGEDGAFIAERLFRWKPELSKSEYDRLSPSVKRVVNKVVTTKPAQPTLEIVAPKAPK